MEHMRVSGTSVCVEIPCRGNPHDIISQGVTKGNVWNVSVFPMSVPDRSHHAFLV
jgi:hypothetical protein